MPPGWGNLAFAGQFCEMPEDVVFTVEYSVRSAQVAAYGLLGLPLVPPPVYQGKFNPRVLTRAFAALHDLRPVAAAHGGRLGRPLPARGLARCQFDDLRRDLLLADLALGGLERGERPLGLRVRGRHRFHAGLVLGRKAMQRGAA